MIRILPASKDAYITNKIINNTFRATDANTGEAGSLDLFKLYNENRLSSVENPIELSRLLIKFPIDEVISMDTDKEIDINDPSFKAYIKLHDVYGGQTTPDKFRLILFPLAKNFDEGQGIDVVNFSDISACNYITASFVNGSAIEWDSPGANASGILGESNIDIITSGTLNPATGVESLSVSQYFEKGTEDLYMDVTKIVSGTAAGIIPDYGFLIAYSGSYEKDEYSYFVKRFSSRNAVRASQRPKLYIQFNDSIQDNHNDMIFNITSSLYLQNYHYESLANIVSGSSATAISGENCMKLKIESGSFKKTYDVSQAMRGRHRLTGVYSASFALNGFDTLLYNAINTTGSIVFNEIWTNEQETVTYLSSSLTVYKENRRKANTKHQNNVLVSVLNINEEYRQGEKINIRVFAEDRDRAITFVKTPYEKKSMIYHDMHFRLRDVLDGSILIDFDKTNNSTKLSTDDEGMFFNFHTDSLPKGRTYTIDFLINRNGKDTVIKDAASKFRVV